MKSPSDIYWCVMSLFSPAAFHHPQQLAEFGKGITAAAVQYVAAAKQQDAGKLWRFSNLAAGIRTGAAMTAMSLALLQLIGG